MLELNKPSSASDLGKGEISRVSLNQTRMSVNFNGQSTRLANTSVKSLGQDRAESAAPASSMFKARGSQSTLPTASSLGQTPGVGRPMPGRISSLMSLNRTTSLPLSRNAPKEPSLNLARQPAGQQRSISSSAQEKSAGKPLPLALRTIINPGVESARLGNRTPLKISTSTGQGKTTTENGAMGSRISSFRKLPSISSKPIVAPSVQPRVAHVQVDEASPPATSAKPSALESQLNNTFVFGQHSALVKSTLLSKDVANGSEVDAQEIILIQTAEEKQDKGDMTLSFPAAEKTTREQDDVQNMGMVALQAGGGGQLTEIHNKGIGDMSMDFEGEATGVDELDQVYRMLQRKHEEAKELLVRVMINHNLLVRMNEKYSYENIEKKRQNLLSLIACDTAEE
ncbi:unnamed protein product [Closterium sp. NIES-53]